MIQRWKFTIAAIAVAVVAIAVYQWFNRTPEQCKPVVELLDFNHKQSELIAAKAEGQQGAVPSQNEQLAYQQWADGLSERAGKITDPGLAAQAVDLAQLANQFVSKLPELRAAADTRAPGAPAPAVVYEISSLNDRITAQIAQLTKACKR